METAGALRNTHHFIVLHQHHVVSAEGGDEDDTGDTFKAVDPLLPLGALATHVKHPTGEQGGQKRGTEVSGDRNVFFGLRLGGGIHRKYTQQNCIQESLIVLLLRT